jgi:hypothetical protein
METNGTLTIHLESALLCLDLACNTVFDGSRSRHCPACGAEDTYPITVWLDRVEGHRDTATGAREPAHVVGRLRVRAA